MIVISRKEAINKDSFTIEIIDGQNSHSIVARIEQGTISPLHGTPAEYAKVICDAVSRHMTRRSKLSTISIRKAQEEYANGTNIFYIEEDGGLNQVNRNTEFSDFPKRKYLVG